MLSRKLLSLLISLLLMLSPFASLDVAAAAATAGEGHCMRMDMDMGMDASESVDGYSTLSVSGQPMSDCAHCKDDSCSDSSCASHGCSTGSLSLINTDELPMRDYKVLREFTNPDTDLSSHNPPPLLRPPV